MKHNKLLLGLLSAGIATSAIPLISLAGCSCSPTTPVVEELEVDDSLVYYQTDGYIRTETDTSGACYLTGFKLKSGQTASSLTATVENLEGTDASTYVEIEQLEQSNYFNVNVYFSSQYPLVLQYAAFDLKISDNNQHQKTFTGFKVFNFSHTVRIRARSASTNQTIGTLSTAETYEYMFKGVFSMVGSETYGSEELKKLKVSLFNSSGKEVPENVIKPEIVVNEEDATFEIKLTCTKITSFPETQKLHFVFTSSNTSLEDWESSWHFDLNVYKTVDKIFECSQQGGQVAVLNKCYCTDEEITVPDQITIGSTTLPIDAVNENAFNLLPAKTINFPDCTSQVLEGAISNCNKLTKLKFGKSFATVEGFVSKCPSLETIELDSSNEKYYVENNALITKADNNLILATNKTTSIPTQVTMISEKAFECRTIDEITIHKEITIINNSAFYNCPNLKKVIFEEGLTISYFGSEMFADCYSLEAINLPESLVKIPKGCFDGCIKLKSIVIPSKVLTICPRAFANCMALESVVLPESLILIEAIAFMNCLALTEINIPASVKTIERNPFMDCSNLEKITVSSGNTNYCTDSNNTCLLQYDSEGKPSILAIGTYKVATIPQEVNYIGPQAFRSCSGLTNLNLNKTQFIGYEAFQYCVALTDVTFPISNKIVIDDYAFSSCLLLKTLNNCENIYFLNSHCFSNCVSIETIDLSGNSDLTATGSYTFMNCTNLKTVKLSSSITEISDSTFGKCTSLETIDIPDSVIVIAKNAFRECAALKNVNISDNSQLTTLGSWSFGNCVSLESIKIPKLVTIIKDRAFENDGLTNAYFKDPKNWYLDLTPIDESELADSQKAAEILLNTHESYLTKIA